VTTITAAAELAVAVAVTGTAAVVVVAVAGPVVAPVVPVVPPVAVIVPGVETVVGVLPEAAVPVEPERLVVPVAPGPDPGAPPGSTSPAEAAPARASAAKPTAASARRTTHAPYQRAAMGLTALVTIDAIPGARYGRCPPARRPPYCSS
jgi:hypothetical protein